MELSDLKKLVDLKGEIVSYLCRPAVAKGENHNSLVLRAQVVLRNSQGENVKKSFIIKRMPESPSHIKFVKENEFFQKELQIYTVALKEMESLMKKHDEMNSVLWGKLYGFNEETLVMEDLQAKEYQILNRREMLGIEESCLVLKELARYHAMSKILFVDEKLSPQMFRPWMYLENDKIMTMAFHNCLKALGIVMKNHWGPEWGPIAEKILKIPSGLKKKLKNMGEIKEENYNVLNHGDCWTCNLLIKYEGGNPYKVKFIDFPVAHYNSFAWDVLFFIFNSVKAEVRREHCSTLVKTYWESSAKTFSDYKRPELIRGLPQMMKEIENLKFLSVLLLCTIHPLLTSDMTETVVSDKPFKEDERTMKLFTQLYTSPSYISNVQHELKNYFSD